MYEGRILFAASLTLDNKNNEPFWDVVEPFLNVVAKSTTDQDSTGFVASIAELVPRIQSIDAFNELWQGASFKINAQFDRPMPLGSGLIFIFYRAHFILSDHVIVTFVLRSGEPTTEDSRLHCTLGEPIQSSMVILKGTVEDNAAFIEAEANRLAESFERRFRPAPFLYLADVTHMAVPN